MAGLTLDRRGNSMQDFESRIADLEKRVADLEAQSLGRPMRVEAKAPPPVTVQPPKVKFQREESHVPEKKSSVGVGSFLGVLAVICFVLAGSYIVRLAIDSGLLTPERQVLIAALFGFALVWTGLRLAKDNRHYAAYLPAAGVVVLHLCVFGATSLYGLISSETAILGAAFVSLLCVALFHAFRTTLYSAMACVGAYLVPFLLRSVEDPDFIGMYFIPCSIGFAALAVMLRYRPFLLFSGYLAIGLTNAAYGRADDPSFAAGLLALHFVVILLGVGAYSLKHKEPLSQGEALAFTPLLLFFYAIEHLLLSRVIPEYVDWLALGFVVFLNLFQLAVIKRLSDRSTQSGAVVRAFSLIVVLHAFYLNIVPWELKPLLMLTVLGALALAPSRMPWRNEALGKLAEFVIFLLLMGNYFGVIWEMMRSSAKPLWLVYGISYSLALLLLSYRYAKAKESVFGIKEGVLFVLAAGHLQALFTLHALTRDHGSLAVSGGWAAYALAILALGFGMRSAVFARSSLVVLMAAAGKALLYDVSSAAPPVRILCLLLTGALLYGSGYLFQRIREWQ